MNRFSNIYYYILIFFILFLSCLPLFVLFKPGLPLTHDGQDHVARIANFYQSLSEGNIVPRWAGNLNWGYGHPILMFLYPLPSYISSFFHFVGFSFIDSVKLVFGLGLLAGGFAMWLWIRSFLGKTAGILAAFLYMFAPYRFVDLYVRGALGEHVAFIFPPLVLYFILKLYKDNGKISSIIFGSFFLALLILSHNAISLMFLPFIFAYMLLFIFITKHKRSLVISYILIFLLGFGLSAFFWVPAFFEGKYTHRDILTAGVYAKSFPPFSRFISSSWSFGGTGKLSVEIGKTQWLIVLFSFPVAFLLFKKYKKRFIGMLMVLTLIVFWLSLFLMTPYSSFLWEKITILQKFQFSWRFLTLTVFSAAVMGGIIVSTLPKKLRFIVVLTGIVLLVVFNKDYWKANGYVNKTDKFFSGIYFGTTDTGESSPRWAVSYMREVPKVHLDVISGKASVEELERLSTKHVYKVNAITKIQLRENTLYFPGWNILADGKKVPIEYQARNNMGVMTFFLPRGEHVVVAQLTETRLRVFANIISGLTLVGISFFFIINKLKGVV